ncbi:MAG: HD domain-containing protein [Deltaproteobacteria bacterium]|nr:HD domain-containing protein [Deltaproteobacteria bacterium]
MLQLESRLPALVIDPDAEFLKWLQSDPATVLAPPVLARTGKEAQTILSDRSRRYSGIFVNPSVADPGGLSVLRCAHLHHIGTPLFLLYDGNPPFNDQELKRLAVHQALRKPLSYAEILALVAPIIPTFDASSALAQASLNKDALNEELLVSDRDFNPIRIENFLSGHKSFFDVYVRLKNGRYLKILQAADAFSEERVTSYIQKGVRSFFIHKDAHASYVSYCDHLATALLRQTVAPLELQIQQVMNSGEETLKFLSERNIPKGTLDHALRFSMNIQRLVTDLKFDQHPLLRDYIKDAAVYEHGVGASLIAGLLMPRLKFSIERLQVAIGMATLLHDVGLHATAPGLEDKEENRMTLDELRLYHAHPKESARILATVKGVDSIALHAVFQHHERRDGKGFPNKSAAGAISLVSEIVGISDEFVRLLRKAAKDPQVHPMNRMHTHVFHGFSYQVMKAFIELMDN